MVDVRSEMEMNQKTQDAKAKISGGVIKQKPYSADEAYRRLSMVRNSVKSLMEAVDGMSSLPVDPKTRAIYNELPGWLDRLTMAETTTIACGE